MAPKVTEEHVEARREQILMAAMACFAEKGFHKTTIKDICKKSNLSAGAVYSYFDSKDDLINALREWGQKQNQASFSAGGPAPASPREAIGQVLSAFILRCQDPNIRMAIRADVLFLAEALSNEKLAECGTEDYNQIIATIVDMVERAKTAGCVDPGLNVRAISEVMFSLVQGLHIQLAINPELDIDTYAQAVDKLVFGEFWNPDGDPRCDGSC